MISIKQDCCFQGRLFAGIFCLQWEDKPGLQKGFISELTRLHELNLEYVKTAPCPLLSNNKSPLLVPISRLTPHRLAQLISELNRFLYFLISGMWSAACWGRTLTGPWGWGALYIARQQLLTSYQRNDNFRRFYWSSCDRKSWSRLIYRIKDKSV